MFCKTSARYDVRYIFRVYIIVNPRCVSDFADGGEDERIGSRRMTEARPLLTRSAVALTFTCVSFH